MVYAGPIGEDEWDSGEPLVGGLPLFLRLILFQYGVLIVVSFFVVSAGLVMLFKDRPLSVGFSKAMAVAPALPVFGVWVWVIWSWLKAYQAKRWAVASLGIASVVLAVAWLAVPTDVVRGWPDLALAALLVLEGVYLLRLQVKLKRLRTS